MQISEPILRELFSIELSKILQSSFLINMEGWVSWGVVEVSLCTWYETHTWKNTARQCVKVTVKVSTSGDQRGADWLRGVS